MVFALLFIACSSLALAAEARAEEVAEADSIRKYRFLAKTSRDKKEYDEALKNYREYLKYQPDDVTARFFAGDILYRQKNYTEARQAFEEALALDSLHVNSNLRLYAICLAESDEAVAALCLERVLVSKPEEHEYRRKLADLYRRLGESERAIDQYERLVAQEQSDQEVISILALLHEDLGHTGKALEWRQRLLGGAADASGRIEQLENMVELQLKGEQTEEVYATLLELASLDSLNGYSYYSRLAGLAEKEGHKKMRLKALEGMVRANPKDVETVATLVEHHLNQGDTTAAKRWLERGLNAVASAHLQLLEGDMLVRQGKEEEAIAAFERAKADPRWERVAQQRIWQLRPPETEEEKLKKAFFGQGDPEDKN